MLSLNRKCPTAPAVLCRRWFLLHIIPFSSAMHENWALIDRPHALKRCSIDTVRTVHCHQLTEDEEKEEHPKALHFGTCTVVTGTPIEPRTSSSALIRRSRVTGSRSSSLGRAVRLLVTQSLHQSTNGINESSAVVEMTFDRWMRPGGEDCFGARFPPKNAKRCATASLATTVNTIAMTPAGIKTGTMIWLCKSRRNQIFRCEMLSGLLLESRRIW